MINEAQGMRISFKELLLLKGIADAMKEFSFEDEAGNKWVESSTAARGLSKMSLGAVIDRAIGNGLIEIDDTERNENGVPIMLTKLGARLLKAAEPSYASKVKDLTG